jgi:hypothetical protein
LNLNSFAARLDSEDINDLREYVRYASSPRCLGGREYF